MTQVKPDEKLIDKIRKVWALSTSNNPHEAALALSRVHELLLKHNLTMADIQAKDEKPSYIQSLSGKVITGDWRKKLIHAIAKAFFCKAIAIRRAGVSRILLIGEKENVDVVWEMYSFVEKQLSLWANRDFKRYKDEVGFRAIHGKMWKANYFAGANYEIYQRLNESQQKFESEGENCKALVLVKEKDLQEAVEKAFPDLRKNYYQKAWKSSDGLEEGRKAGQEVQLRANKEIEK